MKPPLKQIFMWCASILLTQCFSLTASAQWDGEGTEANPYKINNRADLENLARNVNNGTNSYPSKYFQLTTDLDFQGPSAPWTPIGTYLRPFQGNFDGNNHVISRLYVDTGFAYGGFIGYAFNGAVSNLGLENVEVYGGEYAGGLVGYSRSPVSNCYVTGTVIATATSTASSSYAGILMGRASTVKNCYSSGSVSATSITAPAYAGGLIGYIAPLTQLNTSISYSYSITNSYSSASVSVTSTSSSAYAGGLFGFLCYGVSSSSPTKISHSLKMSKCYATGSVSATSTSSRVYVGGLIGYFAAYATTYAGEADALASFSSTTNNCYSSGSVVGEIISPSATAYIYAGGLIGYYQTSSTAGFEWNTSGDCYPSSSSIITNCYSTGNVTIISTSSSNYIGGFIGALLTTIKFESTYAPCGSGSSTTSVSNCYATGLLERASTTEYIGGLIGYSSPNKVASGITTTVTNCYYDKESTNCVAGLGSSTETVVMKSQSMVDLLNGSQTPTQWKYIDGRYPSLNWEEFFNVTINEGSGTGGYKVGETVSIQANNPEDDMLFDIWAGDDVELLDSKLSPTTSFLMPNRDVTFTATYKDRPLPPPPATYDLTVVHGIGSGVYAENSRVNIVAYVYADSIFTGWSGDTSYLDSALSDSTWVTMPAQAISLTATYKDKPLPPPPATYDLTVLNGIGGGVYAENTRVNIVAYVYADSIFTGWSGDTSYLDSALSDSTWVTMPAQAISLTATYKDRPLPPPPATYDLTVVHGIGSGVYAENSRVNIVAYVYADSIFTGWSGDTSYLDSALSDSTWVTMPAQAISLTATYKDKPLPPPPATYDLTVLNGIGGGVYAENTRVNIVANVYADSIFTGWSGDTSYLDSALSDSTWVTMPAQAISLTATYKDRPLPPPPATYDLTVVHGIGSGVYAENSRVNIVAYVYADLIFTGWSGDTSYLDSALSDSTWVTMPDTHISVTANYRSKTYLPQSITTTSPLSLTIRSGEEGSINAKATSGLMVNYNAENKTVVHVDSLGNYTGLLPGETILVLSQPGNEIYAPAESVKIKIIVSNEEPKEIQLTASQGVSYESILLKWETKETFTAYRVYRNGTPISKWLKGTEYEDRDMSLIPGEKYRYYVGGKLGKNEEKYSNEAIGWIKGITEEINDSHRIGNSVARYKLMIDSIGIDNAEILNMFTAKCSVKGYYNDIVNHKVKKITFALDPLSNPAKGVRKDINVLCKGDISLYNVKNYKNALKTGITTYAFINDTKQINMLDSYRFTITLKNITALKDFKRNEYRYLVPTYYSRPLMDSKLLQIPLESGQDTTIIITGKYFGKNTPKAWIEYKSTNKKGKVSIKKINLKVSPIRKSVKSAWSKSKITDTLGNSECIVTLPLKKWQKKKPWSDTNPPECFVISTGKGMTAIPVIIQK